MKEMIKSIMPDPLKKLWRYYLANYWYKKNSSIGLKSSNLWIQKSAKIKGWLNEGEHEFLWDLASRKEVDGNILEIGSWMGKSTCILAGASKESHPKSKVISIDTFWMSGPIGQQAYHNQINKGKGTFYEFIGNAKVYGFYDTVVPIGTESGIAKDVLKCDFRMAFIDGAHDFESCLNDTKIAIPILKKKGILALHDYGQAEWPGVKRVVDEFLREHLQLKFVGKVGSIIAFERHE